MNYYRYKLITSDGQVVSGITKLPYKETLSAANHLERNGSVTLYVKKLKGIARWAFKLLDMRPQRKLSRTLAAEVFNNLSLMLRAGLPMMSALEEACQGEEFPGLANDFEGMIERIQSGASFSEAAEHYPHIFPKNVLHLIRMGEDTGQLEKMLKDAAEHLLRMQKIVSDTKQALLYPCFVIGAITGGMIFWFAYVVPKIVGLFKEMDVALPTVTRALIKVSEFVQQFYLPILAATAFLIVLLVVLRKQNRWVRKTMDRILLHVPIVKTIINASVLAFISEYFAMLINAGIDILQSIHILSRSVGNEIYREKIASVGESLEHGDGISDSFKQAIIFPNFVVRMIHVGENSGTLPEQLDYIAEQYRSKLAIMVSTIGKSIEPLILLIAGTLFAVIIIGLFLPIYDLVSRVSAF